MLSISNYTRFYPPPGGKPYVVRISRAQEVHTRHLSLISKNVRVLITGHSL